MGMQLFNNQVVLITGGSQGIGAAMAEVFHAYGCRVAINHLGTKATAKDTDQLVVKFNAERPQSAHAVVADVSSEAAVVKMMQDLKAHFGGIDYLINNAGIVSDKTVAKMTLLEWQRVLDINLTGVFLCSKYGAEIMRDHGAIVSISSISGQLGAFGQANYAAAKAGIIGLTRTLHRELARRGIRVNAIAPGLTKTTITKDIPDEYLTKWLEQIPLKRQAEPEEIAKVAAFLCSDLASYVTGQTVSVNGGAHPS